MTHNFTYLSSQLSNLETGMENNDHIKKIGATSGIDLIFENKNIMSEVDWKPKVGWPFAKSSQVVLDTSRRLGITLVPSGVGLAHQSSSQV